jgi:hypothetical protein
MPLTQTQQKLRREIEEIATLIGTDFWNAEQYRPSTRTICLELMKDKLVRGEVVAKYTLADEFLTNIICDFYFRRGKTSHYGKLWKTPRFKLFVHHIMDETYLMKKLTIVHAIKAVPKDVSNALARINDTRNALAHSLFPQNRRRYVETKKVVHNGVPLFTPEGVARFRDDVDLAVDYLKKRIRR